MVDLGPNTLIIEKNAYTQYLDEVVNREMFDTIPQGSVKFTKK